MKKTILIFAATTLAAFSSFAQNRSIKFETGTFAEAQAKAKAENKPIMMDAYTTWCGPCKMMAKHIFTNDTVADFYNANFIGFKSDMEKGEGLELAKRFEVRAYPSFIFIAPDGSLMHRMAGSCSPKAFVEVGKDALSPEKRFATFQKKYEAGERNPEFVVNYINMKGHAALDNSKEIQTYFTSQKDADLLARKNWNMLSDYTHSSEAPQFQRFLTQRDVFSKAYTKDSVDQFILGVYENDFSKAMRMGKPETQEKLKTELVKMNIKDANKVIWTSEAEVYQKKGDLQKYSATIVKLVDTYYLNMPPALNNYAWNFYEKVTDKSMLQKAQSWSQKAVQLEPSYANLDTHAAVLYKLGKKKDAKAAAESAIAAGKKSGEDVSETESMLQKINALK